MIAPDGRIHQGNPNDLAGWLAAWEDDKGDLHAPATVYVEVDPRHWSYADQPTTSRYTVLRPPQVEQHPTDGGRKPSGTGRAVKRRLRRWVRWQRT